jgi:hypothetical protein
MNEPATNQLQASQGRRKTITLAVLLVWVVAVFTYSILKFARVIT